MIRLVTTYNLKTNFILKLNKYLQPNIDIQNIINTKCKKIKIDFTALYILSILCYIVFNFHDNYDQVDFIPA